MTAMLSPDLLDRRALAWLRLVDVYGRPVTAPVHTYGEGVTTVRKADGSIAVLSAAGLEDYSASLLAPSSPAVASRRISLDLEPQSAELDARRFELRLPRDPDPAKADRAGSIFRSVEIEMLPSSGARLAGSACALRVTVRRKSDKKLVEHALVRAQSEDGQFSARGLTDPRGEATLIFPALPIAFPGAGANLRTDINARVVVTVDAESVKFNSAQAGPPKARRTPPFVDPDDVGSAAADFASGTQVTITAGREVPVALEWVQP